MFENSIITEMLKTKYLQKGRQEKKNIICQWCFEEPALEGKSVCQACIDAANKKEDDNFDLDKWLDEE